VRPLRLALAVVVLATGLAHSRGLAGGFVYDDHRFVERNAAIESLRDPLRFFLDPTTASAAQGVEPDVWRPLRTLAFAVDRSLFGLNPKGWHVCNVAIHVVNAALVYLLLLRLLAGTFTPTPMEGSGGRRSESRVAAAAAAGALLFSLHPVSVECVAWISSRGDLLAWLFVLLALEMGRRRGVFATLATVALGVLACLSKESAVVAFALLPLHHLALPSDARPSRRETVVRTVALLVATVAYFAARAAVMPSPADLPTFAQTPFPDGGRAAAARAFLSAVAGYAKALVLPIGFPFDRNVYTDPVPVSWADPSVIVGLGLLVSVFCGGVLALRRRRGVVAFSCLGSLAVLVPVSNVIVPLKTFSAERFLYPLLPCLAAGSVVAALALARALRPALVAIVAAAALVTLGVLTDMRTAPWHDELSLWTAVQRAEPMNPRAYEGLGFEWLRAGRLSKAEQALRTYVEFQPFDGKAHALLAAELLGTYRDISAVEGQPGDPGGSSERLRIPSFLLTKAIEESRAADRIWGTLGLERGRGDRRLRRATLEGWRTAALEYGDLDEARRVNDLLADDDLRGTSRQRLALAGALDRGDVDESRRLSHLLYDDDLRRAGGVASALRVTARMSAIDHGDLNEARRLSGLIAADRGPGQDDAGAVEYAQRRMPTILACLALALPTQADSRHDLARRRTRADALEAAGVSAELSDADAYRALLPKLDALLAEKPTDDPARRNRVEARRQWLRLSQPATDAVRAELAAIESDLAVLVEHNPKDRALTYELSEVRALLGRR
jgi:protein O-mannosyl-transferase